MADADKTPEHEVETALPARDKETGAFLIGEYPANRRARAEALAADGKATDEAGVVSDDLIADAKDRLAREAAAAEAAKPSVSKKRDELVDMANKAGVEIEPKATKPEIVKAIEAAPAANKEA